MSTSELLTGKIADDIAVDRRAVLEVASAIDVVEVAGIKARLHCGDYFVGRDRAETSKIHAFCGGEEFAILSLEDGVVLVAL